MEAVKSVFLTRAEREHLAIEHHRAAVSGQRHAAIGLLPSLLRPPPQESSSSRRRRPDERPQHG
ncbi:hypothetical protein ACP4OV_001779 [Aristida adscensionis]